jgi:hypothetical protein
VYTLDTTHWPLPFDRSSDKIFDEILALLPSRTHCARIKEAFFESFATVRLPLPSHDSQAETDFGRTNKAVSCAS